MSVPPGRSSLIQAASAASTSGIAHSTWRESATLQLPSGRAGEAASEVTNRALTRAAAAFARAARIISGALSRPVTA
jgi:hypothetical protein